MSAVPPLIPNSTNFETNYSVVLECNQITTLLATDGICTIADGTITNLVEPANAQGAIPYNYLLNSSPGGPVNSIQYNNSGSFEGSTDLLYIGSSSVGCVYMGSSANLVITTTAPNVVLNTGSTVGNIVTITGSNINNLNNPVNALDIVTRNYVDFFKNYLNVNTISAVTGTYSASSMVNGLVVHTGLATTGIFSTANALSESLYSKFYVLNNSDYNIVLSPGPGAVFVPSNQIIIYPGYILNCTLMSQYVIINSNTWTVNYISNLLDTTAFNTQVPYKVTSNLFLPGPTSYSTSTSVNYTYSVSDVNLGLIVRNPTGNSVDTFVSTGIGNQSFIIQNISSYTITLSVPTGWTFLPSSSVVISGSHVLYCSIYGTIVNIITIYAI